MPELSHNPLINAYNMDCMGFMRDKPDNYYDLAIVDPPYGIGDTFIGFSSGCVKGSLGRKHKRIKWDESIPNKEYFTELHRVSVKRVVWGANYFNCFENGALVWYKNRGGHTLSQCEIASVSGQNKVDYVYLQVLTGFVSNESRIHPTQKPVALYRWLLKNYAKEGDKILDTHGGSFSSAIACHTEGYALDICELDTDYFNDAVNRFKLNTCQEELCLT